MVSLLLRPLPEHRDLWHWRVAENERPIEGPSNLASILADIDQPATVTLIVPGTDGLLIQAEVSTRNRRHIASTVPWDLEDELADEIETQHFAFGGITDNKVETAVVSSELLSGWLDILAQHQLSVDHCVLEQSLLPQLADGWSAWFDRRGLLIRTPQGSHYCDAALSETMLQLLYSEYPPQSVQLWVAEAEDESRARALFPDSLQTLLNVEYGSPLARLQGPMPEQSAVELLQGDFGRKISWAKLLPIWRTPIAAALAAAVLAIATLYLDVQSLQRENDHLQQSGRAIYHELRPDQPFPGLGSARQEADDRLARALPVATIRKSRLSELLYELGKGLQVLPDASVVSLNFKGSNGSLIVEFDTDDFGDIQKLRDQLGSQGINTRLNNSTKVKKRLRVRLLCSRGALDQKA